MTDQEATNKKVKMLFTRMSRSTNFLHAVSETCELSRNCFSMQLPNVRVRSLPFAPPPRWANEVPGRLRKAFPNLSIDRHVLYLKALIHPSYTTDHAKDDTMSCLSPLGAAILKHAAVSFVTSNLQNEGVMHPEVKSVVSLLIGADALSAVIKGGWGLDDLILTDAIVREFCEATTAKGLLRLSQQRSSMLPVSYHRQCVEAIVGAVYLDHGAEAAVAFVMNHVFQLALEYLSLGEV